MPNFRAAFLACPEHLHSWQTSDWTGQGQPSTPRVEKAGALAPALSRGCGSRWFTASCRVRGRSSRLAGCQVWRRRGTGIDAAHQSRDGEAAGGGDAGLPTVGVAHRVVANLNDERSSHEAEGFGLLRGSQLSARDRIAETAVKAVVPTAVQSLRLHPSSMQR